MRKMALLLIVLAISLPSYGILLVYNFDMTFKGGLNGFRPDANGVFSQEDFLMVQRKLSKAFVVLDINEADYTVNGVSLIPYNGKGLAYGAGAGTGKDFIDDANLVVTMQAIKNRNAKYAKIWVLDFTASNAVVEVNAMSIKQVKITSARIIGKAYNDKKLQYIRYQSHEIAPELKGYAIIDNLESSEPNGIPQMIGTAAATMTLNKTITKPANDPFDRDWGGYSSTGGTFEGVVAELKARLAEDKGYTAVTQGGV
jgi:hypothetical protein